jgi:hypothetical protein
MVKLLDGFGMLLLINLKKLVTQNIESLLSTPTERDGLPIAELELADAGFGGKILDHLLARCGSNR